MVCELFLFHQTKNNIPRAGILLPLPDLPLYVAWCLFLLESLDNTEYLYITVSYVIKTFLNAVFLLPCSGILTDEATASPVRWPRCRKN